MNTEEYIKKELSSNVVGNHPVVVSMYEKIADNVIDKYRKHEYLELIPMLELAAEKIKDDTGMVSFLIKGGTIQQYADYIDVCYGTARQRLNKSPYAARNTETRPYRYYLKK